MNELMQLLKENEEAIRAARTPEQLLTLLEEKSIKIDAGELRTLVQEAGFAALDDSALETVAGGISPVDFSMLVYKGLSGGGRDSAPNKTHNPTQPAERGRP